MRTRIRCTIAGLTALGLLSGGAVLGAGPASARETLAAASSSSSAPPAWSATATRTASDPFPGVAEWSATATYTGGQQVVRDGRLYTAGWWTRGADPRENSGAIGSGRVWQPATAVTPTPASTITPAPARTAVPTPAPTPVPATDPARAPGTTTPDTGTAPAVLRSGYKDITINMDWNTHQLRTMLDGKIVPLAGPDSWASRTGSGAVTLAFASGTGDAPSWAGVTADEFRHSIDQLVDADVDYVLATGGASATFTANAAQLDSFISRYASKNLIGIDFDIEQGQTPAQIRELAEAAAVAEGKYPGLRFSFTLPTSAGSDGRKASLNATGVETVAAIEAAKLRNYTVNLMAMDYGRSASDVAVLGPDGAPDMGASAVQAARNVHETFGIPYSKLELTVMIGVNDTPGEVTTVADLEHVAEFVKTQGLAGLHLWSVDRDTPSATGTLSPSSSGTSNASGAYSAVVNRAG